MAITSVDDAIAGMQPVPLVEGLLKVWSGAAWVSKPAKVWSGAAWNEKPVKVWNGSAWI